MEMDLIQFSCEPLADVDLEYIIKILPRRRTQVLDAKVVEELLHLKVQTNCITPEEAKSWIKQFEENTKTTYTIASSKNCTGRYLIFKQHLRCQHNTRNKTICDLSNRNRIKNTNCPSAVKITLHAIKKRYQGKNQERSSLLKEMPCEIDLIVTHNHDTDSADALRYRKVSSDVEEKLISLYNNGHSPATALEAIKMDIRSNYDDYESILADRKYCPDYMFCYSLYRKIFKKEYGPLDPDSSGQEVLTKKIAEYNEEMKETCAQIIFQESHYIICICPPQLKRVHQYCESSSQMVFMDSTGTTDHGGSQMFILLTHGECGGLPLGVIITSSKNVDAIQMGFQLLKDIVGSTIFGGFPEGPTIFLTDDWSTEQSAINAMWPRSKCLLCINHVLKSVWKWLVKAKNIPQEQQNVYFQDFKSIMFSTTTEDCLKKYEVAKSNINHDTYRNYFEGYWQRKELWALTYRNNLLTKGNNTNNLSELIMTIIKDKIYNRVKAFNVVQLIDFILTKFVTYYETRLMDTANNLLQKNIMGKTIKLPPPGLMERIQTLNDSIILVPSETKEDFFYIVNIDCLTCTCFSGNTGKMCKHVEWACASFYSEKYSMAADNVNKRKMFYYIATGSSPPKDWLLDIDKHSADMPDTCVTSHIEVVYEESTPSLEEDEVIKLEEEAIKERGQIIIQEILEKMASDIEKSPRTIVAALEKMNANLQTLHTTAGAASAYSNFALGQTYRRKNSRNRIHVQPTALSRKKACLLRKKQNVKGQFRNIFPKYIKIE